MTNFERIKAMSVEEMAEYIASITDCDTCPSYSVTCKGDCRVALKQYLESEVQEECHKK